MKKTITLLLTALFTTAGIIYPYPIEASHKALQNLLTMTNVAEQGIMGQTLKKSQEQIEPAKKSDTAQKSEISNQSDTSQQSKEQPTETAPKEDFIKWVDFNVSYEVLDRAYKANSKSVPELLAYVALKNGNSFKNKTKDLKTLNTAIKDRTLIEKYKDNKYYNHYLKGYHTILDGIINPKTGELKGYHPIAKGFWYSCYDDFGNSRGYGYKRRHLGHDLFGSTGTPIIAVESGTVTELGWNRYGGWRVGIRCDDKNKTNKQNNEETTDSQKSELQYPSRYYYYAHLRKDRPYATNLKKGDKVTAGQVIGFLGNTGYSRKENVNMKQGKPHLHFGIQLIFDPSQEDGNGEIWIDCNTLCKFLNRNRAKVEKDKALGEWRKANSATSEQTPAPTT